MPRSGYRRHQPHHIHAVEAASQQGPAALDPDTIVSRESYDVALKAVAGTLAAADAVVNGDVTSVCAVRPLTSRRIPSPNGVCLFNNVAILARYLQQQHGLDNILIID